MKTIRILRLRDIFLLLVLLSLALSCGSDDNGMDCPDPTNANCDQVGDDPQDDDPQDDDPVVLEPTLSSVAPVTGPKHTEVVITGENFGTDATKVSVSFNGTPGEVLGVTDTEVTVRVPARAYTGPITMEVDGFDLTGPEFVYELSEVNVETFAGVPSNNDGGGGFVDGPGTVAKFDRPQDLVMDSKGNLFVSDNDNDAIRKIDIDGNVTTFAGGQRGDGDGTGTDARFNGPKGMAIDGNDNIYLVDGRNNKIKKITPSGEVSTIVGDGVSAYRDGPVETARFHDPTDIAIGKDGNLYLTERGFSTIRRISLDDNFSVSTYAGSIGESGSENGDFGMARFNAPVGLYVDDEGNFWVTQAPIDGADEHKIRKVDWDTKTVGTITGGAQGYVDGGPVTAKFANPYGISVGSDGTLIVADKGNHCIRRIDPEGMVETIAGVPGNNDGDGGFVNGPGDIAEFQFPVAVLYAGNEIYVVEEGNGVIRRIILD
ncbi:IPT/TIG domain-containing protein [Flagellimonas algicola]|nr:IPT/TIG domain-containing protein [Allomuricauda algicola]